MHADQRAQRGFVLMVGADLEHGAGDFENGLGQPSGAGGIVRQHLAVVEADARPGGDADDPVEHRPEPGLGEGILQQRQASAPRLPAA